MTITHGSKQVLEYPGVAQHMVATQVSVAQWIERWFPVPKVAGSNPVGDTLRAREARFFVLSWFLLFHRLCNVFARPLSALSV